MIGPACTILATNLLTAQYILLHSWSVIHKITTWLGFHQQFTVLKNPKKVKQFPTLYDK